MANGGALFFRLVFANSAGVPYAGAKVYTYDAGTTTPKTTWLNEGRTSPAPNPLNADNAGVVSGFGDGLYRLRVEDASGILLYDYDGIRITADTGVMWEGDHGTVVPAASAANAFQMFAKVDGQSAMDSLLINANGVAFEPVPVTVTQTTESALPTPAAASPGRLRRVTDGTRGLWFDTGTQWVSANGRVADVREFGAKGDGATVDDTAFQAAADALEALGGGVLFIPRGTYVISQFLIASNVTVQGSGVGATILVSSSAAGSKGMISNKQKASGNGQICIRDLTMQRTVQAPGHLYNECLYFQRVTFLWIERCAFIGSAGSHSSSNRCITLDLTTRVWITRNSFFNWPDTAIALDNSAGGSLRGFITIAHNQYELTFNDTNFFVFNNLEHVQLLGNKMHSSIEGRLACMVTCGLAVNDMLVTDNQVVNCRLIISAGAARRVSLRGNQCRWSGIEITSTFGDVADLVIQNNELEFGRISVIKGGFLMNDVVIKGNKVARHTVNSEFGLRCENASRATIAENVVHECQGGGFGIYGGEIAVLGNRANDNGAGGNTTPGMREAFYISCSGGFTGFGRLIGNFARNHPGVAYYFVSPQGMDFIDNASFGHNLGFLTVTSPTQIGTVPFQVVEFSTDTLDFNPNTTVYAMPGSIIRRRNLSAATKAPVLMKTFVSGDPGGPNGWAPMGSSLDAYVM